MSDTRIDTVTYAEVMAAKTNPNHTPPRSVRVTNELWEASRFVSMLRDETITDIVNVALAQYVLDALAEGDDGVLTPRDRLALKRTIPESELRRIILHVTSRRPGADVTALAEAGA